MFNYMNPYIPQAQPQAQPQPQQSPIIWVQGEAGAKSYLVAPGTSVLMMDSESSRFYIKTADQSGMPCPLRIFEYNEIVPRKSSQQTDERDDGMQFVTRNEFMAEMEKIKKLMRGAENESTV